MICSLLMRNTLNFSISHFEGYRMVFFSFDDTPKIYAKKLCIMQNNSNSINGNSSDREKSKFSSSFSMFVVMLANILIIFLWIIIIMETGRSQMQRLYKITELSGEVMKCKHLLSVWLFIISYGRFYSLFRFLSTSFTHIYVWHRYMLSLTSLIRLVAK